MAEGIPLGIAENVLMSVSQAAVQEVASCWHARGELEKLRDTITIVNARIRDAEKRYAEEDADAALKEWLRRLRDVLYKADDLFDEVYTVDQQRSQNMEGNHLAKKVRFVFSRSGPIQFSIKIAREIKSIREELDAIKSDKEHLNLRAEVVAQMPVVHFMRKRETGSFVQADNVIGREVDKNHIIEVLLLKPNIVDESITVIPIVGFGGIGKTTLAQLVFNDERVKKHFDLTKWTCVPDIGNNRDVIEKVFKVFIDKNDSGLSLEQLQSGIRESVNNKKYLLVLDDIWDESRDRWLDLMNLLRCGKRGSKIIITTRSYVVAKIVGTIPEPYKLGLLTDEASWNLFKGLAFKPGQEECNPNLVTIGKEIVKRCGNVPLAIRAMGSTLYTKDTETEWMQFRGVPLSKKEQSGIIDIMPVLKLSYDHLPSNLKQCFAYCALFPKDHKFWKHELILLWMAQGFIKPLHENGSLENAGDQYFHELLMRNFFQCDENSLFSGGREVLAVKNVSCKMHDLVHDLALHVSGEESILVDEKGTTEQQFRSEILHASVNNERSCEALSSLPNARRIRSMLNIDRFRRGLPNCEKVVSSFTRLRSLDLRSSKRVPGCIGKLSHLRYVDLSHCSGVRCLPHSITTLWNLQTLKLYGCSSLEELPTGFSKLANLRHLDVECCGSLADMPAGFQNLKSLQTLTEFKVGKGNGLDALADMNLRGALGIEYRIWREHTIAEAMRANLKQKHRLSQLTLKLSYLPKVDTDSLTRDRWLLLEQLHPPPSLNVFKILGDTGERLPRWMGDVLPSLLPNLVQVEINRTGWRFLASFSQLPCLKRLILSFHSNLEYIESGGSISCTDQSCSSAAYFPSLEYPKLEECSKLKGWWRSEEDDQSHQQNMLPIFPRLSKLEILYCPNLMSMPVAPRLEFLKVIGVPGKLLTQLLMIGKKQTAALESTTPPLTSTYLCELKELIIVGYDLLHFLFERQLDECTDSMESLIKKGFHEWSDDEEASTTGLSSLKKLEKLSIGGFPNLTALPESIGRLPKVCELFIWNCPKLTALPDCFPQLGSLQIWSCPELRALPNSLPNLTKLYVCNCPHFGDFPNLPMLQYLSIRELPNLTALPESMGNLHNLRKLCISYCPELSALPDSFSNLIALQTLWIMSCPKLSRRCQQPHGDYWSLIQHVSNIALSGD